MVKRILRRAADVKTIQGELAGISTRLAFDNVQNQVPRGNIKGADPRRQWYSRLTSNIRGAANKEADQLFPYIADNLLGRVLSGSQPNPIVIQDPLGKLGNSTTIQFNWPPLSPKWLAQKRREGGALEHFSFTGDLARKLRSQKASKVVGGTSIRLKATIGSREGAARTKVIEKTRFIGDLEITTFVGASDLIRSYLERPSNNISTHVNITKEITDRMGDEEIRHKLLGRRTYPSSFRSIIPPMLVWWAREKIPNAIIARLRKVHRLGDKNIQRN